MIVLQHVIKDEEIVGIGPLIKEPAMIDPVYIGKIDSQQLYFQIYLIHHIVKVESLFYDFGSNVSPEVVKKSHAAFEAFKAEYERTRAAITQLISKKKP